MAAILGAIMRTLKWRRRLPAGRFTVANAIDYGLDKLLLARRQFCSASESDSPTASHGSRANPPLTDVSATLAMTAKRHIENHHI
ncbi:hypothetical protein [Paraburkholderia sediminicola]|uniref:hypothetical protein n=1 Tax=Paraburkholderia sediminicola TaxID=458836 RepID=UPI0038B89FA9